MSREKIPYELSKRVYGVGWFGYPFGQIGKAIDDPRLSKKCFSTWKGMMARCYSEKHQEIHPTYKGCTVDERWHCYKNFVEWFKENYYEVEGERMELDKDIIKKGNKVYSPDRCIFVSRRINQLFANNKKVRGDHPVGVRYNIPAGKLIASCNNPLLGKIVYLGVYDEDLPAFNAYKAYKESVIKQVADYYKKQIPPKLYDAMYRYKIKITD